MFPLTLYTEAVEKDNKRGPEQDTRENLADRLMMIGAQAAALPVLDPRDADEIIGYDEFGVPR